MKVKIKLIFFLLVVFSASNLKAKEIAISFDDAPRRLTGHFTASERAKYLIKQLNLAGVNNAVFFCNSAHINKKNKNIIQLYNDSGFTIANHTHSHPSFNNLNFNDYSKDFLKADKFLSQHSNFSKMFRFPYLKEGNELTKRNKMRKLLQSKGYINAYITVDFSDWHLEDLFRKSLKKGEAVDLGKLKNLYISLAKESLEHYDSLAKKYLLRSPKHVLLLHETDIAALFIKDLIESMRSWGWKIISSEDTYKDQISTYEIKRTLKNNPGRVGEIAIDKGPTDKLWAKSTYPKYISERYFNEVMK